MLVLLKADRFPDLREEIPTITTVSTIAFEIFGPVTTRLALDKAGETGDRSYRWLRRMRDGVEVLKFGPLSGRFGGRCGAFSNVVGWRLATDLRAQVGLVLAVEQRSQHAAVQCTCPEQGVADREG